jgi:ribosomal protein S16
MLIIRLKPGGKKHRKHYRISIFEKHKHVTKKTVEDIGWYNPYTKEISVNKDRLDYYLSLNIEKSDTVGSLLKKHQYIV